MTETEKGGVDPTPTCIPNSAINWNHRFLPNPAENSEICRMLDKMGGRPMEKQRDMLLARLRDEMKRADAAEAKLREVDEIARRKVTRGDVVENVSWLVEILAAADAAAESVWGHAVGLHTWGETVDELDMRRRLAEKERDALRAEVANLKHDRQTLIETVDEREKELRELRSERVAKPEEPAPSAPKDLWTRIDSPTRMTVVHVPTLLRERDAAYEDIGRLKSRIAELLAEDRRAGDE